ncbi:MAG: hypothetical protein ABR985_08190 [Methanotrichaceae archaeon]
MIEGLASRFRVEECSFNSIFGTFKAQDLRQQESGREDRDSDPICS